MKKASLVLFLLLAFCAQAVVKAERPSHWGKVLFINDNQFYIQTDDGNNLIPMNLPDAYKANGLKILFDYETVQDSKVKITKIEME